ncbi:MAG TPA: response regulator [Rhizomicrobium sp.]|nr:response regulator [Rhizomicrobium sp.]
MLRVVRIVRIVFGVIALIIAMAALGDIMLHSRLTIITPITLVALIGVGIAMVLHGFLLIREKADALHRKTTEFAAASAKLENSLKNASAMNARLHESEQRYRGLVDSQGDAIFRRAADSRLTYANDAFFKLFGLAPKDAIGFPFAPELHPDSRAPMFGSFAGLETGKGRVRYDQHVRTAYGWRWIAWEDYAIRDAFGRLVEVQSVGRDVTERKALEDALTEARDRAEAGSRAKSGFLATMSHEIRTPMNGVLGMARLLLETELKPDQRTYTEAISQSGEALLSLIGDILDFSKIESGMMTLEEEEVELRSLVEGVVELLGTRAHAKGIEILSIITASVPRSIRTDGMRLRQVLTNLVGNAIKFTDSGGVCIAVAMVEINERRTLRFEVRDTGVGVADDKREDIFNEFVQADSSHARRFGGSGLGLAISRRLVGAMGGEIGVQPGTDDGSMFWFTVPAYVVQPAQPGFEHSLADLTIAIVTRNAVLREGLTAQIRAAGGEVADLIVAEDGSPSGKTIDVMLVDAGTQDPAPPIAPDAKIPAIVLVTPQMRSRLDALKQAGFGNYLVKPVRHTSLVERLHDSFGTISTEPPPVYLEASAPAPKARLDGSLKILLAEDNPINALLTRELLRRRGHVVSEVVSGEEAVLAMKQNAFDLLLTDIHMPGLDGVEATKLIRTEEKSSGRPRTPIVALTADVLETGKSACRDAGMDGFLAKPVDPAELDVVLASLFPSGEDESALRHAAA